MDVGGGASSLVDRLLDRGYGQITVVDVSEAALDIARRRLGARGAGVTWLVADVRELRLAEPVDVWHDRAVLHFLTEAADRSAYRRSLASALRVGGHAVIATFGPEGPTRCSGLPVERYDTDKLAALLGPGFRLAKSLVMRHVTPAGASQEFTFGVFHRLR